MKINLSKSLIEYLDEHASHIKLNIAEVAAHLLS